MAFVTEDGTGKTDSNSYGSVSEADAYFADREVTAWAGTEAQKKAALIKGTDYIESRFSNRFIGAKKTEEQALSWPRSGISTIDDDVIPSNLKKALFEYALRALSKSLAPDLVFDESGTVMLKTKKKIGPIETDYQQASGPNFLKLFRPYPAADILLKNLVSQFSGQVIR